MRRPQLSVAIPMTSFPKVKSILTDRYQTTVPEPVRRALYLGKGDKLHYTILPGGEVMLSRAQKMEEDPLLGRFLEFLARDIANNPRRLQSVDADLVTRINNLVGKDDIDLDVHLSADDE